MIKLFAHDPSFGNCPGIISSLSRRRSVRTFFKYEDLKGMHRNIPFKKRYKGALPLKGVDIYIVGVITLWELIRMYGNQLTLQNNTRVIITDSFYRRTYTLMNSLMKDCQIYCMPDLLTYCDVPNKVFYQPFETTITPVKDNQFTICHSPFSEAKKRQKGTDFIEQVVNNLIPDHDVHFKCIMGKSWDKTMQLKSKAHFFVDQVCEMDEHGWSGGLGKSGIEAMALGCLTFTSGVFNHNGQIPPAPVVSVTRDSLEEKLRYYITHPDRAKEKAAEQKQWVEEYLNYDFQSKYLS